MSTSPVLRVGLLGCGTVGSAVAARLLSDPGVALPASGIKFELARVAVLDPRKQRSVNLPPGMLTSDSYGVVTDPEIDVVVEAIGGIDVPRRLLLTALICRKHVVTANKALIAASGWELSHAAVSTERALRFEAAVGGATPAVETIRHALAGERIERIVGSLNGTSNHILDAMESEGLDYEAAVAQARSFGLAESDPSADVEGHDSASKLAILISIATHRWVIGGRIRRRGISDVSSADLSDAISKGYRLRAIAEARFDGSKVRATVRPTLVPETDPLARLEGAQCGLHLYCASSGRITVLGTGAGGEPTAAAVMSDLISIARSVNPSAHPLPSRYLDEWIEDGAPSRKPLDEPIEPRAPGSGGAWARLDGTGKAASSIAARAAG